MRGRATTGGVAWLQRAVALALFGVCTYVTLGLWAPDDTFAHAALVTELVTYPVMLAASGLLYVYFRLAPASGSAWLTTVAVFVTANGTAYAAMRVLDEEAQSRADALLLTQAAMALVLVFHLLTSPVGPRLDPVLLGLGLAAATSVLLLTLVERVEPWPVIQDQTPVLVMAVLLLYAVIGLLLARNVRL